ncbi:Lrp/AsnC ligand binding domain-containing protein [Paenarthrobacter sp. NPDC058040]|uniref:Lrp/AsnC ligand binding domain-containing protein n=1 Tax=unclassified Paenarthrobacter TaxID=2634190 RepID=UPI0036DAB62E
MQEIETSGRCMQDFDLDQRDLRLLHALQVRPRAPWTALAPIVGADAVTLARRWSGLQSDGLAWMTSYLGTGTRFVGAIVEIEGEPAALPAIVQDLARDPEMVSIDQTAGGRDLIATVLCRSDAELSRFLVDRIPTVTGIKSTRTHRVIRLVTDAQKWRLRSLRGDEVEALEQSVPLLRPAPSAVSTEVENELIRLLLIDGRASVSDLAQWLSISPARAKGALSNVLGHQRVVIRLEVARTYTPWPVSVWYFMRMPATKVEVVATSLAGLDETRLVVITGGIYSLMTLVWLRRVEDMAVLERQLGERMPYVEIADRSIVLRTPKHMGKRLEPDGRRLV